MLSRSSTLWLCALTALATTHLVSLPTSRSPEISNSSWIASDIGTRILQKRTFSYTAELTPVKLGGNTLRYTVQPTITNTDGASFSPNLILDTGSWRFWMYSTALDRNVYPPELHVFLPFDDPGCDPSVDRYGIGGNGLQIGYHNQPVKADLGGLKLSEITISAVVSLTSQARIWTQAKVDGILGMDTGDGGWLSVLMKEYTDDESRRFTIDIPSEELIVGNNDHVPLSNVIWAKTRPNSAYGWTFDSDDHGPILIDSGSPIIALPPAWAQQWLADSGAGNVRNVKYNDQNYLIVRCQGEVADIKFNVRGETVETVSVPGSRLIGMQFPPVPGWCFARVGSVPQGWFAIFGLPLLEEYITIFDFGDSREIGFALPVDD